MGDQLSSHQAAQQQGSETTSARPILSAFILARITIRQ